MKLSIQATPKDATYIADQVILELPPLWSGDYQFGTALVVREAVGRLFEGMKDQKRWKEAVLDGLLHVRYVNACEVTGRGDKRYDEAELVEAIRRGETLVPPILADLEGHNHILDGHHRTRAYCKAQKPMLAIVLSTRPMRGDKPTVTLQVDVRKDNPVAGAAEDAVKERMSELAEKYEPGNAWDEFMDFDFYDTVDQVTLMALIRIDNKPWYGGSTPTGILLVRVDDYVFEGTSVDGKIVFEHLGDIDSFLYDVEDKILRYYGDVWETFNEDFWGGPPPLLHGTDSMDSVLREGLVPASETRGLGNRSVGEAVFTTTEMHIAESYGMGSPSAGIVQIDTAAMKRDGYMPFVSQEPQITGYEMQSSMAAHLGIEDFAPDEESGIDPDTVVVYGKIQSKYLTRLDWRDNPVRRGSYIDRLVDFYGTTYDPMLGGWLLPTGEFLDFSEGSGSRSQDHRNINWVSTVPEKPRESRYDVMARIARRVGMLRWTPESWGIEAWTAPTAEQASIMRDLSSLRPLTVDAGRPRGRKFYGDRFSREYEQWEPPSQPARDLRDFYAGRLDNPVDVDEADLGYLLAAKGKIASIGPEKGRRVANGIARYRSPHGSVRYVMYQRGEPVSALQVVTLDGLTATTSNVYTVPSQRGHRFASELLEKARKDFDKVTHTEHRTKAGAGWVEFVMTNPAGEQDEDEGWFWVVKGEDIEIDTQSHFEWVIDNVSHIDSEDYGLVIEQFLHEGAIRVAGYRNFEIWAWDDTILRDIQEHIGRVWTKAMLRNPGKVMVQAIGGAQYVHASVQDILMADSWHELI